MYSGGGGEGGHEAIYNSLLGSLLSPVQLVYACLSRACICKRLWSPEIDSKESISPAYVAWRFSTTNRVIVPAR
jgi:hypothetical protein